MIRQQHDAAIGIRQIQGNDVAQDTRILQIDHAVTWIVKLAPSRLKAILGERRTMLITGESTAYGGRLVLSSWALVMNFGWTRLTVYHGDSPNRFGRGDGSGSHHVVEHLQRHPLFLRTGESST